MKTIVMQVAAFVNASIWRKRIVFGTLGAIGGYAYYYFIGCSSGACPITSNPWISTVYGVAISLVWTLGDQKKAQETL